LRKEWGSLIDGIYHKCCYRGKSSSLPYFVRPTASSIAGLDKSRERSIDSARNLREWVSVSRWRYLSSLRLHRLIMPRVQNSRDTSTRVVSYGVMKILPQLIVVLQHPRTCVRTCGYYSVQQRIRCFLAIRIISDGNYQVIKKGT